jgi:hypothetical protein
LQHYHSRRANLHPVCIVPVSACLASVRLVPVP